MSDINTEVHPDQVVCRTCGEKRVKTFGKSIDGGRIIWVNEYGQRWYGKRCPHCYKQYKEFYDKKRRLKLGFRPFGSVDSCQKCGKDFIVKIGSTKTCSSCKASNIRKQMKLEE